jgi:hypothetical protein
MKERLKENGLQKRFEVWKENVVCEKYAFVIKVCENVCM